MILPYSEKYRYTYPRTPSWSPGDNSGVPGEIYTNHNRTHHGPVPYTTGSGEWRYNKGVVEEPNDWNLQNWPHHKTKRKYSSLFIDIYDDSNQRMLLYADSYRKQAEAIDYVDDKVCIPNIPALEDIVFTGDNFNEVKAKVKALDPSQDVNGLFNQF